MNARHKSSIATAIHLRWLGMRALLKAHKPFNQLDWSAAHQAATIAFKMAAPFALSNLHSDLIAPVRLQQKLG